MGDSTFIVCSVPKTFIAPIHLFRHDKLEYSKNPECIIEKINEQRQEKELELERLRRLKEIKELRECTFTPSVRAPSLVLSKTLG